jgi:hypothetical protein
MLRYAAAKPASALDVRHKCSGKTNLRLAFPGGVERLGAFEAGMYYESRRMARKTAINFLDGCERLEEPK